MQLQPSCWERMAAYVFECKERVAATAVATAATTAGKDPQVPVPAAVLTAGLDVRMFAAIHFLKAHDDSYTFHARPTKVLCVDSGEGRLVGL